MKRFNHFKFVSTVSLIASAMVGQAFGTPYPPSSFSVLSGSVWAGGLSDLFSNDNLYLTVKGSNTGVATMQCDFGGIATWANPGQVSVYLFYFSASLGPGPSQVVSIRNWTTNAFDTISATTATPFKSQLIIPMPDMTNYINQFGATQVRVRMTGTSAAIPFMVVDLVEINV